MYVCFHAALVCLTGTAFIHRTEASGRRYIRGNRDIPVHPPPHTPPFTWLRAVCSKKSGSLLSKRHQHLFFGRVQPGGVIFRDCGTPNVPHSMFFPAGMDSETTSQLDITEHNPFSEIGPNWGFEIQTVCELLISVLRLGEKRR